MERCPVCRARCRDADVCRRCRTDVVALRRIAAHADRQTCLAVRAIAAEDYQRARQHIRQANSLQMTPFVRHLQNFIEELQRNSSQDI